ncbi:hypothetical protein TEQG_00424 [Trichophyton equinum CBS 127.97]|uniref:Uncharacterized protein n=1 Tax=Trichophyton equinum (strain ATCC MYA-4606 / CBS 127.97) TaxID=559882 RepID=F2PHK4_TRIEC|nr:hypothetical protein TEQG_00424 [Trichophyton equinum CBS 127.97]
MCFKTQHRCTGCWVESIFVREGSVVKIKLENRISGSAGLPYKSPPPYQPPYQGKKGRREDGVRSSGQDTTKFGPEISSTKMQTKPPTYAFGHELSLIGLQLLG